MSGLKLNAEKGLHAREHVLEFSHGKNVTSRKRTVKSRVAACSH